MEINAYLYFNGNCREAFEFYARCLGGEIVFMQTFEHMPAEYKMDPALGDKIMHARIRVGNAVLMGSDNPPEYFKQPQGFDVTVSVGSPEEAERIFAELSEGGTIKMPIAETFWAKRFGSVTDRFGTPWNVNCENPM